MLKPSDARWVRFLSMSNHGKFLHPRDEIMQTMERIYRYRTTTTSGGNLSLREADGSIWITPAGIDKGSLTRDDIVCLRADGTLEGKHKPSSELPFHQMIYDSRPDIRGVVHAHPVALVAFSIVRQRPDEHLLHQSKDVCGTIGFATYALPGSINLGRNIAETFSQNFDCVILANHEIVTGGENLQDAFQKFETLEFTAKTIIKARILGDIKYLTDAEIELPNSIRPLEEFERGEISNREKDLRQQLCSFTRRGYRQRLFISTGGSFSARLDDESFLITPYHVDRYTLTVEDIVLVKNGKREGGKLPSRAAKNHHGIYNSHPEINSILKAFPVNATAFGVTDTQFDSRTIPESYVLLRDINRAPYARQFLETEELAKQNFSRMPDCFARNAGALVIGKNVLEAFDRLEVLESTAEAIINSRLIGNISPMSEGVINELKKAFPAG